MSRLRSTLVLLVLFFLHITLFAHFRPFGVAPDMMLLAATVGGSVGGFRYGARHGFAAGLLFDLMAPGPFGLAAGVYGLMGYSSGMLVEAFDPQDPRVGPGLAGLFSLAGVLTYGVGLGILGAEQFVEWRLVGIGLLVAIVNVVAAIPARVAYQWVAAGHRLAPRSESSAAVVN